MLWSARGRRRRPVRESVDLGQFPQLVVIYIGITGWSPRALLYVARFLRRVRHTVQQAPEGLLGSDHFVRSLFPPHLVWRQYWVDVESLERWARTPPHSDWWRAHFADPKGTRLWHEMYSVENGFEAIYDDVSEGIGLRGFASVRPARGPAFTAPGRLRRRPPVDRPPPVAEAELYDEEHPPPPT